MARIVLQFSMSLDGFVAGAEVGPAEPMGIGGEDLHAWMGSGDAADAAEVARISSNIGAVIVGRRTFELGLPHWNDTPFPAPSFVLTHRPEPDLAMKSGSFTFVTGLEEAARRAKAAAGASDVVVMGADTCSQMAAQGLADLIRIQIAPLLLGRGVRPFEGAALTRLRPMAQTATAGAAHLEYEIIKSKEETK